MSPTSLAKILFFGGILLIVISGLVYIAGRFGLRLGHLPGDIVIKRDNFTFSFPLASSILVSIVLTILINLAIRFFNR